MAQFDERSRMRTAQAEGEARGEAKGEAKVKVYIAKAMLAEGFDKAMIAKITKLSPEEIAAL